ncbi:MAG: hypothetical protein ACXIUB_05135 [Wenzhouxiangella sp.]
MSPPWSKLLERLAKPLGRRPTLRRLDDPETIKQGLWHEYAAHDLLFQLYGPEPDSAFYPYHCPTIFAAVERLNIQPRLTELAPEARLGRPDGAWEWLDASTFVLIDLPGALSVQMAVRMMAERAGQPIATFDHWPAAGVQRSFNANSYRHMTPLAWPPKQPNLNIAVDSTDVLNVMVTLAPRLHQLKQRGIKPDAPALMMCDSRRTVASKPSPGDFDNRYFIDDAMLPSSDWLQRRGVSTLAFFGESLQSSPSCDLTMFINECHRAGMKLINLGLNDPGSWAVPLPMMPPPPVRMGGLTFPKSRVGGFGKRVPVPSESSGGSFSGAGG